MKTIILLILFFSVPVFSPITRTAAQPPAQSGWETSPYKGWKLVKFEITGLDEELSSSLKKGLATQNLFSRIPGRKPAFYPQTLIDDLKRIRLFLARRGYPNASVVVDIEPHPTEQKFSLTLEITAGIPIRVETVALEGFPASLDEAAYDAVGFGAGSVFSEQKIEAAAASLERMLKSAGYARAQLERDIAGIDSSHVSITFRARPGASYRFGNTTVAGVSADLVPLVRKTISVKKGTAYSPGVLNRARDNLRLLDLFRKIRLGTAEAGGDTLTIEADLIPRKFRSLEFGVGYWTDGQVYLRTDWYHRNLFRAGRGLSATGYLSRHLQSAKISFWWPALIAARTKEALSAKIESQREESYNLVSTGGELVSNYRHSINTAMRSSLEISNVDVTVETSAKDAFEETGGLLTALAFRWTRNVTDDRLSPTRGSLAWLKTEWAPNGFISHSHYASLEVSGAVYFPLRANTVLAGRLTTGLANPTGDSPDLLPNKRFYAGGANSMRGFERRKLGPQDAAGAPLGGEAKLESSVEVRAPLIWRFRCAVFVDAGQVWSTFENVNIGDLEAAAGPGLMLRTPVGPIRADLGWRLTNRETTQRDWVFHLTIGQSF